MILCNHENFFTCSLEIKKKSAFFIKLVIIFHNFTSNWFKLHCYIFQRQLNIEAKDKTGNFSALKV